MVIRNEATPSDEQGLRHNLLQDLTSSHLGPFYTPILVAVKLVLRRLDASVQCLGNSALQNCIEFYY